ncbi:hypothetical protein RJJ65_25900 [Rhizobium hidalgonense]|uniref:Uncharacterized protein n=1 Tax=Rhizobium hidalgonense TaxID=1538159 RepID=A0AAJ2GZN7_9HYPH|nr:hypothetical protein [Rhizobium hidalgonense]MDR9776033.1 hypothetical protein [Rhizobium hidalgonense]MDR9814076.1 hypothetical protein [Rhizobium hidalgonense]MDR9820840.1 hypothetical protein [Rhizobium hidalgonense]
MSYHRFVPVKAIGRGNKGDLLMQGGQGRNDDIDHCDHGQSSLDHGAMRSRTDPCIISNPAHNEQCSSAHDRPRREADTILFCAMIGLSGAIIGFVLAGHLAVAGIAYAALVVGGFLGWLAREAVL